MIKLIKNNLKFNFTGETLLVIVTLLLWWAGYYVDNKGFFKDSILWLAVWGIGAGVFLCVCFPAWWIVLKKREGFEGVGITTKKLGLALILGILLGGWRFIDLFPYLKDEGLFRVVLYNIISIWEVFFIYGWLFTRYKKAFGKIGAVILTTLSVGLYHIGSFQMANLLYLMLCVFICSICLSITNNIFTLWPIYWSIGTSASVLSGYGSEMFGWDAVISMCILLVIHLICLGIIKVRAGKVKAKQQALAG